MPPFIRSAIEEELEVLYDAYYDELEQYANIQQRYVASGGAHPPPPGPGPFPGSVEVDQSGAFIGATRSTRASAKQPLSHPPQVNGRKSGKPPQGSEFDDDEQDDEEYEEDRNTKKMRKMRRTMRKMTIPRKMILMKYLQARLVPAFALTVVVTVEPRQMGRSPTVMDSSISGTV
jgi:hypothetical protein